MEYDFGFGPVPAHRHSNGGGWIADSANVSEKAYVGAKAKVAGGTIWGGTIWGGTIRGGTIRGGTIWGGTIWGGTIDGGTIWGGTIWGGTIRGGTIRGGTIDGGTIWGGTIRGGAIWGGTVTKNVTFITGFLPYSVTIADNFVGIGCQWFPPSHWIKNGQEVFEKYGIEPQEASNLHALLLTLIEMHGCVDES